MSKTQAINYYGVSLDILRALTHRADVRRMLSVLRCYVDEKREKTSYDLELIELDISCNCAM